MAKLHLDRLKEKYPDQVSGANYRDLMEEIISSNHENIHRAIGRVQSDHWGKQAAKIKRSTSKQISVPGLEDVLPKRSVFLRKGSEQGQMISDSLRDQLTSNLRESVKEYLKEGKGSMQYKRGEERGRIRPELIDRLQASLTNTFEGYTKPDATGVPPNIRTIAETEARSAISDIKHQWAEKLQEQNQGKIQTVKIWRHHPSLSKRPRPGHRMIDGQERPINVPFKVPELSRSRMFGVSLGGYVYMMHPHDPTAPADQVIGCHCEVDYITRVL